MYKIYCSGKVFALLNDHSIMAEAGYRNKLQVVSDDDSKPEILSRIAQATVALSKLKPICRDNNISLGGANTLPCQFHISVCLRILDLDSRVKEMNAGL